MPAHLLVRDDTRLLNCSYAQSFMAHGTRAHLLFSSNLERAPGNAEKVELFRVDGQSSLVLLQPLLAAPAGQTIQCSLSAFTNMLANFLKPEAVHNLNQPFGE